MKKLISLLLALILCLGVFVACDNEENPELEIEATKSTYVNYYYHETASESLNASFESNVAVVESYREFLDFIEQISSPTFRTSTSIKEEIFDNHYVLMITRGYCTEIGYRRMEAHNDECSIILDKLEYYDTKYYHNGEIVYGEAHPASEAENATFTAYYDFVLIPKSEVDIELTEQTTIELYTLTYPIER